jgi:flagellar motor switch protein FliG
MTTAAQRMLKEVDGNALAVALKVASDELLARIYKNLSSRAGVLLKDDIAPGADPHG